MSSRPRVLILIVAYEASTTIEAVLTRIPHSLQNAYEVEVLAIDDASKDDTFERAEAMKHARSLPFNLHVLFNPVNQGYGGNQKIGFHYAIEHGFDYVVLLHGDGQYAPERLPELLEPLAEGRADAVFGSRMMTRGDARRGGMPLYKWLGNRILTSVQNRLLRSRLSEFHSGYRVYAVNALRAIPFELNSHDFHFDTEIIIQLMRAGLRIVEVPIPTYYGDEICRVNGIGYAANVMAATLKARAQDLALFYDPKFDVGERPEDRSRYESKLDFDSPHTLALERIPPGSRVLDVGCGPGHVGTALHDRGSYVVGIDDGLPAPDARLDAFIRHDLNSKELPVGLDRFDHVLLLDVIEHLRAPEQFVASLRQACRKNPKMTVIVSTGNIGFVINRLMLLLGQFNYGKRGILDLTHTRLFTFSSLRRLFVQAGFVVREVRGVAAPFPLALGDGLLSRALLRVNKWLIAARKSLFSYQMFFVFESRPPLEWLLDHAQVHSAERSKTLVPPEETLARR